MDAEKLECVITGSTGFVGSALVPHLCMHGYEVSRWPRSASFDLTVTPSTIINTEWIDQLRNIDVVIHLASLAHQPRGAHDDSRYFRINCEGTLHLAAAARTAGVKRFIFLSSAKVFGEGGNTVYHETTPPCPVDAYAQSKWHAEQQLTEQFSSSMEIVILRPPLVYGRNAKANFANLIKLAQTLLPLPFAGIDNRRSMIGIDNLIDLITLCAHHPAAAGQTFLCADEQPYSIAEVVTSIRRAAGRSPNLVRCPPPLLGAIEWMLGPDKAARLFGNFEMNCSRTYAALDWKPPFSMEQILRKDVRGQQV